MRGGDARGRGGRDNNTRRGERGGTEGQKREGRGTSRRAVGSVVDAVGSAVRVSERKNEPPKELFADRGVRGEARGEKETEDQGRAKNGAAACACGVDFRG